MAIDFDALRVDELFKDETRTELKEGINTRDINSVVGMTPPSRSDLHEVLQKAYKLIYNTAHDTMSKPNPQSLQSPLLQQSTQKPVDNNFDFTPPKKTLAEQMAETQKKDTEPTTPQMPTPAIGATAPFQVENKLNELQAQIKEKDELIQTLTNERDEAINQQYELEKHHSSKYKELNEKYEDLKSESENKTSPPSVIEDISDDLLDYLKDRVSRMEQKEAMLNQEIGKLKGMLGM